SSHSFSEQSISGTLRKAATSRRTSKPCSQSQRSNVRTCQLANVSLDFADQHVFAFLEMEPEISGESRHFRNSIAGGKGRHAKRALELRVIYRRLEGADLVGQLVDPIQVVQSVDLYGQHLASLRIQLDYSGCKRDLGRIGFWRKAKPLLALALGRNFLEVVILDF